MQTMGRELVLFIVFLVPIVLIKKVYRSPPIRIISMALLCHILGLSSSDHFMKPDVVLACTEFRIQRVIEVTACSLQISTGPIRHCLQGFINKSFAAYPSPYVKVVSTNATVRDIL